MWHQYQNNHRQLEDQHGACFFSIFLSKQTLFWKCCPVNRTFFWNSIAKRHVFILLYYVNGLRGAEWRRKSFSKISKSSFSHPSMKRVSDDDLKQSTDFPLDQTALTRPWSPSDETLVSALFRDWKTLEKMNDVRFPQCGDVTVKTSCTHCDHISSVWPTSSWTTGRVCVCVLGLIQLLLCSAWTGLMFFLICFLVCNWISTSFIWLL